MRTLLIDNHDSYTFNLYQLIARTYGVAPQVLTNDDPRLTASFARRFDALVVSPGPGRPQRRRDTGRGHDVVRDSGLPVLGVCLGHQSLAHLAGARVTPAPRPLHGHLTEVRHRGEGLFAGLPQRFTAVRYHSLCVTGLPGRLISDAWAEDGVVMGIHHRDRPWWGVQFHPESVASRHGAALLANFRDLAVARRPSGTGAGGSHLVVLSPAGPVACPPPVPDRAPHPGPGAAPDPGREAARSPGPPATRAETKAGSWSLEHVRLPFAVDTERAFGDLCSELPYSFWLDSSQTSSPMARFSFLGHPGGPSGEILRYRTGTGHVEVLDPDGVMTGTRTGSIFDVLEDRLRERSLPSAPDLPFDLQGGYAGYFGYELKADCGSPNPHPSPTPDAVWMSASRFLAVDHREDTTWLVAAFGDDPADRADARNWLRATARRAAGWGPRARTPAASGDRGVVNARGARTSLDPERWLTTSRDAYQDHIRSCLGLLRAGESYEICLTNEARTAFRGDPLALYLRQRSLNPAPYAAHLRLGDTHVLCSSPERFLKIRPDGVAEAKPMKGTAPRHADPGRDAASREELVSSAKTRAENLMIVDLLRNDLGKVCGIGSVEVPAFLRAESYATVHQLVTTIRGRLLPGAGPVRAVRACFPGGSMTGAPKLRTMEIIGSLEDRPRGVYSGALGFFGLTGAADLNIVIRTAVVHDGTLAVGAGGAIVLDSDPAAEYEEMLLKLRAPLRGLAVADVPAEPSRKSTFESRTPGRSPGVEDRVTG